AVPSAVQARMEPAGGHGESVQRIARNAHGRLAEIWNPGSSENGAEIFFKDWGAGQPIVFSHGSPLNSDAWEDQMVFLADRGYRCIAHDRRGHVRSCTPWTGNDVATYAADLAALVEELDLHDAVHVGHSTGAGEVVRYI